MKRLLTLSAALCALVCVSPLAASAATVVNGSFEDGSSVVPAGGFLTLPGGSTAIPGWTVTGDSVDWVGTYWQASNGTHSIDLSGNNPGGVKTTITGLTPLSVYRLYFDIAGNPDNGPNVKTGTVQVGLFGTNYFFNIANSTRSNMGWQEHELTFLATSATAPLQFNSTTAGAYGPALDNVRVYSGVPELSTWAMMGLGFLGLALAGRKRLKRAEAI